MATVIAKVERPFAIKQGMTAGSNFNGGAPADGGGPLTPTIASEVFYYANGTFGGKFDLADTIYPLEYRNTFTTLDIEVDLADQSSWSLSMVYPDTTELIIGIGTTEAYHKDTNRHVILPGMYLKLVTVGATAAMAAAIKFAPEKLYRSNTY